MTKFNQLLSELFSLQRLGIKVGLEHTRKLLGKCGNPQNNFQSIHIAGTNGKGSTSAMLASILREAGYTVGLYTSPHLLKFNERIRVNGVPISDSEIVEFMSQYKAAIDKIESTFFETTTAMAFSHFYNKSVDIAIIETGLGGRLDSTNVLKPNVTIITSITRDHTEILGTDLKTIAFEKGGIIKNNVPLVLSPQTNEVKKVIQDIANEKNAVINYCDSNDLKEIRYNEGGTHFIWRNEGYSVGLIGEHQARNAVLAIEAVNFFDDDIPKNVIQIGLKKIVWPARMQKIHQDLPIYYDVAHNPHGIQVLMDTLSNMYPDLPIGLMALKADKELEKIVPKIRNRFSKLIITSKPEAELMDAQSLHEKLLKHGIRSTVEPDIAKAVKILNKNISKSTPGIIFGSHYIGSTIYREYDFSFENGII